MVDEEIKDVSAGPTGAPVNRDARREPEVIEGEIAGSDAEDSKSSPYATAAETRAEPPAARAAPRNSARSLLAGAVGGLIVSAFGLGAGYSLLTSKADGTDTQNRLGALEAQARQTNDALGAEANRESAAVAALDKRISVLEAGVGASNTTDLDKRVAALEAASAGNGAASDVTQRLAAQAKDLRADVDAEKGQLPELSARVAKLESDAPKANAAGPDLAALAARVDKVEGVLTAPKNETRAAEEKLAAADNVTAIAITAEVAEERLRVGREFGTRARRSATARGRFRGAGAVASRGQRSAHQRRAGGLVQYGRAAGIGRDVSSGDRQRDGSFPRPSRRPREGAGAQRDSRRRSPGFGLPDRSGKPARRYRRRACFFR